MPPLISRDAVLFAGETGLMRHNAATGQTRQWMRTDWLGPTSSPIVMADSQVYFAAEDRGLVCAREKKSR